MEQTWCSPAEKLRARRRTDARGKGRGSHSRCGDEEAGRGDSWMSVSSRGICTCHNCGGGGLEGRRSTHRPKQSKGEARVGQANQAKRTKEKHTTRKDDLHYMMPALVAFSVCMPAGRGGQGCLHPEPTRPREIRGFDVV
jgi:hypothetical protein